MSGNGNTADRVGRRRAGEAAVALSVLALTALGTTGAASWSASATAAAAPTGGAVAQAPSSAGTPIRLRVGAALKDSGHLSSGLRTWLAGPPRAGQAASRLATPSFGSNVDANDPASDLAAGQSETGIAAQRSATGARLVLVGWNDISGALVSPTTRAGSLTGVGLSRDGARHFTDLVGLPNANPDQQWSGDPSLVPLGDGVHFAVGSLYVPSVKGCTDGHPASVTVAVSIATVTASGVSFTLPVPVAQPGDICTLGSPRQPANLGVLDKDWLAYDTASHTLAVSYTRFLFPPEPICDPNGCTEPPGPSGNGQIELAIAKVPADPSRLAASSFRRPVVVWPEEPNCKPGVISSEGRRCGAENSGAYVALRRGGDAYVAWERNISSNLFNGDPFVYLHAALVRAGATSAARGGPGRAVLISSGQPHGTASGGTKSLDTAVIAGYNRGFGQDFPRVAVSEKAQRVVFVWNDASLHPLGDVWLRVAPFDLGYVGGTRRVNDDSSWALHFLPAVSVRADGTVCTSWYDRRLTGADSTRTDYFADCRPTPWAGATDVRISTGSTDWNGTSTLIVPNFGDYTDTATDGTSTYFTWSDGRIGVPQPFVDHR